MHLGRHFYTYYFSFVFLLVTLLDIECEDSKVKLLVEPDVLKFTFFILGASG